MKIGANNDFYEFSMAGLRDAVKRSLLPPQEKRRILKMIYSRTYLILFVSTVILFLYIFALKLFTNIPSKIRTTISIIINSAIIIMNTINIIWIKKNKKNKKRDKKSSLEKFIMQINDQFDIEIKIVTNH